MDIMGRPVRAIGSANREKKKIEAARCSDNNRQKTRIHIAVFLFCEPDRCRIMYTSFV